MTSLVYYEEHGGPSEAIEREKQAALIEQMNPAWDDLAAEWYDWPTSTPDSSPSLRSGSE